MNIILIVGLFFFDFSDVTYTLVVYITYNIGNRGLPDTYAHALGLGYIYQANPSCPCYKSHNTRRYIYIYIYIYVCVCVCIYVYM